MRRNLWQNINVRRGATAAAFAAAAADSEGRVPELWLIPEGEAARSLA